MLRDSRWRVIMKNLLVIMMYMLMTGCTTIHSTRPLTNDEATLLSKTDLTNYVVGVTCSQINDEVNFFRTDDFVYSLKKTNLFKEVDHLSVLAVRPDLIINLSPYSQEEFYCMTGPGSLVILTLGLIPFPIDIDRSVKFDITDLSKRETIPILFESKETAWWGSLISVLAISPNWTLNTSDTERYNKMLAYIIAKNADKIRNLKNTTKRQ